MKNKQNQEEESWTELLKPLFKLGLYILGFFVWTFLIVLLGIKGEIAFTNVPSGYLWVLWIIICTLYWTFFYYIKPIMIDKIEINLDNYLDIKKDRVAGGLKSFFLGTIIFFMLFVINSNFSNEYFETRVDPIDAWIVDGGKNSKDYITVVAGNEFESYIFSSRSTKIVDWNFKSIQTTENFKGYSWTNYNLDFLIDYYLNCKYIDIKVQVGFFGLEIIEEVFFQPNSPSI